MATKPIDTRTSKQKQADASPRNKDIHCGHATLHYVEQTRDGLKVKGWMLPGGRIEPNKNKAREICLNMMNMINRRVPKEERNYQK